MSEPSPHSSTAPDAPRPPRLLDQLRQAALDHFGRPEPGRRFADWARRFILTFSPIDKLRLSLLRLG